MFYCLFQCFKEKEYQTECKRNETFGRVIFGTEAIQETWSVCRGSNEVATRQGGAPPTLLGPSWLPWPTSFAYIYISIHPKNIREQNRSGVPTPQASGATKNQSGPCSGTLPEGESLSGGHLHHPGALHDEEGVVHPGGWGYVPLAMCLISLSLSLSCSWFGTILMYRELC